MSGHSKWSQIKRKKAVTDAKKGATFSKIAKEIMVASKLGGSDPQANFRLRFAIEKAKANHVPQNNIQRAIEKGAGKGAEGSNIEEIMYEGYGPGGIAVLILCTTDNKNRTVADIRSYFLKYGGKLAEAGAVSWMFLKRKEIEDPRITYIPKENIEITDLEIAKNIISLLELIEEHDDVQEVYSNFDIKEELLNTLCK